MRKKFFSYVAGSAACAALILLSGCQQTTNQLSDITRYVEEKIAEGKGTEVKSKEQETDTEQAAVSGETEKQAEPSVEKQSVDCYVYQTLPEEVRTVYDEVYDAILYEKEDVALSTLDNEVLHQAYVSVMADHGGLFWVSGYTYTQYTRGEKLVDLHFTPKFTLTDDERMDMQAQIDETVSQILAGIDAQAPDYDKAKYVFDYLASNVAYSTGAPDNQNIISVFVNGETVCQGYAAATQYLLEKLDIPCAVVAGTADGQSHAWNLVKLDGEYYYMDTTWGNATYSGDGMGLDSFINYNYFAVTTGELQKTHQPNDDIIVPVCQAVKDNYYVHENLYFDTWDADNIGNVYRTAYEQGDGFCSVRFADRELYEQAFSYFITDQKIVHYCKGLTSLYYLEDSDQNVLTIKF